MTRRVVITSLGVASPCGVGAAAFWDAQVRGASGIEVFQEGPLAAIPPAVGGRTPVPMAEGRRFYDPRTLRNATMNNATLLAVVASGDCLQRAGIDDPDARRPGVGCYIGTEMPYPEHSRQARGALTLMRRDGDHPDGWTFDDRRLGEAMRAQSAFEFLRSLPNMSASHVSIRGGFQGPVATFLGSGASGLQAILEAVRDIRAGRADGMLAGGAWSPYAPLYQGYLARRGHVTTERTAEAQRPFDRARRGIVPGEAAAVFLLEELDAARARGAAILAEVVGGASRFAAPGTGDDLDVRIQALREGVATEPPPDVLAVTGAGHPELDRLEGLAWQSLLGDAAATAAWVAASGTCGYTGSAAAPLSMAAALLAMDDGILPPLVGLSDPDPACGPVARRPEATPRSVRGVGVSAFSFEGNHATLSLRAWSGSAE